jgi:hypothetical protein
VSFPTGRRAGQANWIGAPDSSTTLTSSPTGQLTPVE